MLGLIFVAVVYAFRYQTSGSSHMIFVHGANRSKLTDMFIHKHEYEIILNNELVCDTDIFLLFLVMTEPKSFEIRQVIRNTWGSVQIYKSAKIRLVFLVGQLKLETDDLHIQQELRDESYHYHDIVQGNFIDSYRNLTYKTVFGLHWMQKYCRRTQFVFKVDDDVIVNVYRLVDFLQDLILENGKESKFVYCELEGFRGPSRNKRSKWYLNYSEYRDFKFPDYCGGPGYIMSGDVALDLYNITRYIPFIMLEDTYIGFGMKLLELDITDNSFGFFMDHYDVRFKVVELCIMKHIGRNKYVMLKNWERIVSAHKNKFLKYLIYFMVKHIVILVITVSACTFLLVLACKGYKLSCRKGIFSTIVSSWKDMVKYVQNSTIVSLNISPEMPEQTI